MHETFVALAEPNRFRIVEFLRAGPHPVGVIGERLKLQQPQVSKHLKVLKEAGLVEVEARGQERVYELRGPGFQRMHHWLERYRELWDARLDQLDELVEGLAAVAKSNPSRKKRKRSS